MWNVEQCGLHFHSLDLRLAHPLFLYRPAMTSSIELTQ
jgi:hypothetical protein